MIHLSKTINSFVLHIKLVTFLKRREKCSLILNSHHFFLILAFIFKTLQILKVYYSLLLTWKLALYYLFSSYLRFLSMEGVATILIIWCIRSFLTGHWTLLNQPLWNSYNFAFSLLHVPLNGISYQLLVVLALWWTLFFLSYSIFLTDDSNIVHMVRFSWAKVLKWTVVGIIAFTWSIWAESWSRNRSSSLNFFSSTFLIIFTVRLIFFYHF